MILMNETQLVNRMSVSLDTYSTWTKNRTIKGGGGIATLVSQNIRDLAVRAGEGEKEDEYIITRIEAFSPALTVVNNYGEQRVTKKEEVEEKWARLKGDLEEIRRKGGVLFVGGDLNKLVGSSYPGVPGNSPEISLGGRLLR